MVLWTGSAAGTAEQFARFGVLSEALVLVLCLESCSLQLPVLGSRAVERFWPALPGSGSQDTPELSLQQHKWAGQGHLTWGDGRVSFLRDLGISSLLPNPANDCGLSSLPSTTPAAAAPERRSSSTSPAPAAQPQPVESVAMELEDRCPICLGSWEEASYVTPCLHQFCYECILRWAETKPECPLCKRRIQSILHSVQADTDYREHVISSPLTPSVIIHQAEMPRHPAAHDFHHPRAPHPWAAEGVPRDPVGSLQPDEWVNLFQDHPTLLGSVLAWVERRLQRIFRNRWLDAAIVENTITALLTNYGMNEELLVQMLGVYLHTRTVAFVRQLIRVAVRWCGREAPHLLGLQEGLPAPAPHPPGAQQDPPRVSLPAPHPLPLVEVAAATPLLPVPPLLPQQQAEEAVPGPSTPSRGRERSTGRPWQAPRRRASSHEAPPANKRPPPHLWAWRVPRETAEPGAGHQLGHVPALKGSLHFSCQKLYCTAVPVQNSSAMLQWNKIQTEFATTPYLWKFIFREVFHGSSFSPCL